LIKATGVAKDDALNIVKAVETRHNDSLENITKKDVIPEIDIYLAILIQVLHIFSFASVILIVF
jgi:hypothetical protein